MRRPRRSECTRGDRRLCLLGENARPDDLKIEIIVRHHLARYGLVERCGQRTIKALERLTECSSDRFTEPTSENGFAAD